MSDRREEAPALMLPGQSNKKRNLQNAFVQLASVPPKSMLAEVFAMV